MPTVRFHVLVLCLTLVATTSAVAQLKQPVLTPERIEARKELGQLSIQYTADAFVSAAANGDTLAVQLFLKAGMPPNAANEAGLTALVAATAHGQSETIRSLLAGGADPSLSATIWNSSTSPLTLTVRPRMKDLFQLLLSNGADPNKPEGQALTEAINSGDLDFVKTLLSRGASVKQGTLVLLAAGKQNPDIAALLLEAGADVNAVKTYPANVSADDDGYTAIMRAGAIDVAKYLLDHGADVNKVSKNGSTALVNAVSSGNIELARLLISRGANVNLPQPESKSGRTPLAIATEKRNSEMVALLVKAGATR